jgi:hypothetical protein
VSQDEVLKGLLLVQNEPNTIANVKNPNWPPREYIQFVKPIAMKYYAHMSMDMLECNFFNNIMDGYVDLCKDLCREFIHKFDNPKKFNNHLDYWDYMK